MDKACLCERQIFQRFRASPQSAADMAASLCVTAAHIMHSQVRCLLLAVLTSLLTARRARSLQCCALTCTNRFRVAFACGQAVGVERDRLKPRLHANHLDSEGQNYYDQRGCYSWFWLLICRGGERLRRSGVELMLVGCLWRSASYGLISW